MMCACTDNGTHNRYTKLVFTYAHNGCNMLYSQWYSVKSTQVYSQWYSWDMFWACTYSGTQYRCTELITHTDTRSRCTEQVLALVLITHVICLYLQWYFKDIFCTYAHTSTHDVCAKLVLTVVLITDILSLYSNWYSK